MLIRIFPHTTDEFEDEIALKDWLLHHLPYSRKGNPKGYYRLRTINGVGQVPPGSVVLFRFKNNIVGSAVVKRDVEPISETIGGVTYKGSIIFDPDSINVYDCSVPIKFLADLTQRNFSYARAYFKLELNEA